MGRVVIGKLEQRAPTTNRRRVVIGRMDSFPSQVSSASSSGPQAGFLPLLPMATTAAVKALVKRKKNKDGDSTALATTGEKKRKGPLGKIKLGKWADKAKAKIKVVGKKAGASWRRFTGRDEPEDDVIDTEAVSMGLYDDDGEDDATAVAQVGALLIDTDGLRRRV